MPERVVVFDSNVLIPLLISASRLTRLFSRLRSTGWYIATSPQILDEVRDKLTTKQSLRKWLDVSDEQIAQFIDHDLPGKTRWVPGIRQAHGAVPADSKLLQSVTAKQLGVPVFPNEYFVCCRTYHYLSVVG